MARQKGQDPVSMMDVFDEHGFFPKTVKGVEERPDGWTLVTTDPSPDGDLVTFFDGSEAVRREEYLS